MRSLTIAGVERITDLEKNTLNINLALTYQIDVCYFSIKGEQPAEGEEVIVEDAQGRLFAGVIVKVELSRTSQDKSIKVWKVDCDDYTNLLDRKLVVETYENMSATDIFLDIAAKYCPDFTTTGVKQGAPVVESTGSDFNYLRPSECFKWLCNYVGWHWEPDFNKDLKFYSAEDLAQPAPIALTTGGRFSNLKQKIDTQDLRNRVYVRGGTMLSDFVTYEYVADGKQRAWILPYKPHDLTISVAGGDPETPGIENIHTDESPYTWMMNYQEKLVRLAVGQEDIAQGTTVAFAFKYDIPVITMVEDLDSQAAIAAVQGGDGVYEHSITDDSLTTLDAAEAAGNADLREHANPRVKGSLDTEIDGWKTGQLVEINLPDRGIAGTYLVQKVTISPAWSNPSMWSYRVEYGGRLLGIADFLQALVSAQQKKKLSDTNILQKIVNVSEKVKVTDELIITPRTPPWYCGDEDAICGFVECSGFFQICAADGLGIDTGFEK